MEEQKSFFVKQELRVNQDVDTQYKPLKELQKRIKAQRKRQMDDIMESLKNKDRQNQNGSDYENKSQINEELNQQINIDSQDSQEKFKKKVPSYIFKGIKNFDKKLTSRQLMQADLLEDINDKDFQDKVAKCFEWRCQKLNKKQKREEAKWQNAYNNDKNYMVYKKGFHNMLEDIQMTQKNLRKFKRGLSIFQDRNLREQLLSKTNAPLVQNEQLRQKLQHIVLSHHPDGPQNSIIQNQSFIDTNSLNSSFEQDFNYSIATSPFKQENKNAFNTSKYNHQEIKIQQSNDQFKNLNLTNAQQTSFFSKKSGQIRNSRSDLMNGSSTAPFIQRRNSGNTENIKFNDQAQMTDSNFFNSSAKQSKQLDVYKGSPFCSNETQGISDRNRKHISIKDTFNSNIMVDSFQIQTSRINEQNNSQLSLSFRQKQQLQLMTPEDQQSFFKEISDCKNQITFPQNPSLFPQKLRVIKRNLITQTQNSQINSQKRPSLQNKTQRITNSEKQDNNKNQNMIDQSQNSPSYQLMPWINNGNSKIRSFSNCNVVPSAKKQSNLSSVVKEHLYQQISLKRSKLLEQEQFMKKDNLNLKFESSQQQEKSDSPKKKELKDPFKELVTTEEFCKKQNVFFDEKDRIKFQIRLCKLEALTFQKSLNKGFKNVQNFDDHPDMKIVLEQQEETQDKKIRRIKKKNLNLMPDQNHMPAIKNIPLSPSSDPNSKEIVQNKIKDLLESNQKIEKSRNLEFEHFENFLDADKTTVFVKKEKKVKDKDKNNPVVLLSRALDLYKHERKCSEDQLVHQIQKVNLDKSILLREKQNVLWNVSKNQDQTTLEDALRKSKQHRYSLNKQQKIAYEKVLQFMKQRGSMPVQEEKQILDGIKMILENGWTLQTKECVQFFDTLGLRHKLMLSADFKYFYQFIETVCKHFNFDFQEIKEHLGI